MVDINASIPAQMTNSMTLSTNLNANAPIITAAFNPTDTNTFNYSNATTIYGLPRQYAFDDHLLHQKRFQHLGLERRR